jgi:hypothetical protein
VVLIDRGRDLPKVRKELAEDSKLDGVVDALGLDEARALLERVEARRRAARIEDGDVAELDKLLDLIESLSPAGLFALFNDPGRREELPRDRA